MEAFGRVIAVVLAVTGLVFCGLFLKVGHLQRQRTITARTVTKEFAAMALEEGNISKEEKERYEKQMAVLGNYQIQITVYERRRFEGENGRVYTYSELPVASEGKQLVSGSYLRIQVTEPSKGAVESLFRGPGAVIITGGRVS